MLFGGTFVEKIALSRPYRKSHPSHSTCSSSCPPHMSCRRWKVLKDGLNPRWVRVFSQTRQLTGQLLRGKVLTDKRVITRQRRQKPHERSLNSSSRIRAGYASHSRAEPVRGACVWSVYEVKSEWWVPVECHQPARSPSSPVLPPCNIDAEPDPKRILSSFTIKSPPPPAAPANNYNFIL